MEKDRIVNLDALLDEGYNYAAHLTSCMGGIDEVHFYETLERARASFFARLQKVGDSLEHTDGLIMSVYLAYDIKHKDSPKPIYAMSFDQAFLNI